MNVQFLNLEQNTFNFHSPSTISLKEFGMEFTKEEWEKLCSNKSFMNTVLEDLNAARVIAAKILGKP